MTHLYQFQGVKLAILPFLDRKRQEAGISGTIQKHREPDEKPQNEDMHSEAIHAAASELIRAVHSQDTKAVAEALKDAFEILDSMPHVEGKHLDSTDMKED